MFAIIVPTLGGAVLLVLWIWAVLDCIATDSILVRNLPKTTWVFLVIFVPTIGAVCWLLLGRPEYADLSLGGTRSWQQNQRPETHRPAYKPVRGPEDDPRWQPTTKGVEPTSASEQESLAARERKLLEREAELAKREAELEQAANDELSEEGDI